MGLAERASSLFGPPTPVKETVEEQGFFLGLIHFEEFVQDAERGVKSEDRSVLFIYSQDNFYVGLGGQTTTLFLSLTLSG